MLAEFQGRAMGRGGDWHGVVRLARLAARAFEEFCSMLDASLPESACEPLSHGGSGYDCQVLPTRPTCGGEGVSDLMGLLVGAMLQPGRHGRRFDRGLRPARLDKQVSRCPARSDFLKLSLLDKLEYLSIRLFVSHVQQLLYVTLCDDAIVLLGEFQDELLVAHLIDICLPYVSNSFSHACVHAFTQRVRPTAALVPGFNEAPPSIRLPRVERTIASEKGSCSKRSGADNLGTVDNYRTKSGHVSINQDMS